MKQFQFSLESALQHRHWIETEAKRLLGLEIKKHQDIETAILLLQNHIKETMEQRFRENQWVPELQIQYIDYGKLKMVEVEAYQKLLKEQTVILQKRQRELNRAIMERKKVEKLREREYARYRLEVRRKELSTANEIAANFVRRGVG